MNNFGIIYRGEDGKLYLYSSYPDEIAMGKALATDPELKKKTGTDVFMVDIRNCPLIINKEKGDKDGS